MSGSADGRRLVAPLAFSALVVASSPFTGELRSILKASFPAGFRLIVGGALAMAVAVALAAGVARIRDRRGVRVLALALAIGIAGVWAFVFRSGSLDVDVVEDVHFLEYGVLAWLFYRVWRERADASSVLVPMLAGLVVAAGDEWVQWFVPIRVGEIRDVLLDGAALACGLIFSLGLDPPRRLTWKMEAASVPLVGAATALLVVALAVFLQVVHMGYEVRDAEGNVFVSRYTAPELEAIARERAARWSVSPPRVLRRVSREDQYLNEGLWHVQERNQRWDADVAAAWHENRILEEYFAPVLDTPSYVSATGHRWPAAQRDDAARRAGEASRPYVSHAALIPIFTWPPALFWSAVTLLVGAVGGLTSLIGRTSSPSRPSI